ncbi:MAG: hypothetical protein PHY14_04860 [Candidatus Gracilibacteria bacterium]|nr:hypothetical protein [Candidatus Gracilibacteria bacterium]
MFNQLFTFEEILKYAVAAVVVGSVILAVLYSIWGGVLLITSGGKEEKVKPAVNHIRHAAIGVVILMLVLFVAPQIARIIGLEYPDVIRPSNIFATIQEVSSNIFGGGISSSNSFADDSSNTSIGSDFTDL